MEAVAMTSMEEGVEAYGDRFVNLQYMTKKHLYGDACTPYHSGNSFFTAHAAFTLQLDQALRLVNPSVATPYWDYTIDDGEYVGGRRGLHARANMQKRERARTNTPTF